MLQTAFIFDVDGVLTDPIAKQVTTPGLITAICRQLQLGSVVALNTGRSLDTLDDRVLPLMNQEIERLGVRSAKIFVAAEKGAVWSIRSAGGVFERYRNDSVSVPADLAKEVRALVMQKYSSTMFFDQTKTAMISVEMIDNSDQAAFTEQQEQLIEDFERMLGTKKLEHDYKIDPTRIATDIESVRLGKHEGIRQLLSWLEAERITIDKFYAFGDSVSDLPMAEELERQSKDFEFVFVGEESLLKDRRLRFPVALSSGLCAGTLKFLLEL